MQKFLSILLATIFVLGACKKKDEVKNQPPRDFTVMPVRSSPNDITIRWTESTDPENSIVKYLIFIRPNIPGSKMKLVASNLSEASSGLTYNESGIPYPGNNPEFSLVHIIGDLEETTAWEGMIVAVDQDGFSTGKYFWTSTTDDATPPVWFTFDVPVSGIKSTSATLYWDRDHEEKAEFFIYLNDVLITSIKNEDYKHAHVPGGMGPYSYYTFTGLTPNTTYQYKGILKDRNGNASAPKIRSFTTTN